MTIVRFRAYRSFRYRNCAKGRPYASYQIPWDAPQLSHPEGVFREFCPDPREVYCALPNPRSSALGNRFPGFQTHNNRHIGGKYVQIRGKYVQEAASQFAFECLVGSHSWDESTRKCANRQRGRDDWKSVRASGGTTISIVWHGDRRDRKSVV